MSAGQQSRLVVGLAGLDDTELKFWLVGFRVLATVKDGCGRLQQLRCDSHRAAAILTHTSGIRRAQHGEGDRDR